MNQLAIDFEAASVRREHGMASAIEHAENDTPGWADHAFALLRQFACLQAQAWTCEQFRAWAYDRGLPRPNEERAFGPLTAKGLRSKVIKRVGYAPTASSNGSPKATYMAVLS